MLAASLVAPSGCALLGHGPGAAGPVRLRWPEPPQVTRIEFVRNVSSEQDVGQERGIAQQLVEFASGERLGANHLVNPMGLAVTAGGERLYVTDLPQAKIFVFDLRAKTLSVLRPEVTKLQGPLGIAVDPAERLYVVDTYQRVVRVLERDGRPVATIADDTIVRPTGVAVDTAHDRVYVADTSRQSNPEHRVHVFDLAGRHVGDIGRGKGVGDGEFLFPTYLAVDAAGDLYVADTMNARVQVFDAAGTFVRAVGGRGDRPGLFERPKGLALDAFGNLYVVDSGWANVTIFNPAGQALIFFAGRGRYPGLLNNPTAIAIDTSNRIYVADTQNFRVSVYQLVNTTAEDSRATAPAGEKGG